MCNDSLCKIPVHPNRTGYCNISCCQNIYANLPLLHGKRLLILNNCVNITLPPDIDLSHLRELVIDGCKSFDIDSFKRLENLEHLRLRNTVDRFDIVGFPYLEYLSLRDSTGIQKIMDNPTLRAMDIDNCPNIDTILCNRNMNGFSYNRKRDPDYTVSGVAPTSELSFQERIIHSVRLRDKFSYWAAGVFIRRLRRRLLRARTRIRHRHILAADILPPVLCNIVTGYARITNI